MSRDAVEMERSSHVRGHICAICGGTAGSSVSGAFAAFFETPVDGVLCTVRLVVAGVSVKRFVCLFCVKGLSIAMLGEAKR